MKKKPLLLVLLCITLNLSFSQQKVIDSLEQQLIKPTNGNSRLVNLIDLGYYYQFTNPTKGLEFLSEASSIALKKKDSFLLARIYVRKANNNFYLGNDSIAFKLQDKGMLIYKAIDSIDDYVKVLANKAKYFSMRGQNKKSKEIHQEVIQVFEKKKDTLLLAFNLGGLGFQEIYLGDYSSALKSFFRGKSLLEKAKLENSVYYGYLESGVGFVYENLKKYDNAVDSYIKAMEIYRKNKYEQMAVNQYINIGNVYSYKKDFDKAIYYYMLNYKFSKKNKDLASISSVLNNIGVSYLNLNNYDIAEKYIDSSIVIDRKLNNYNSLARSFYSKASIFNKKKKI